MIFPSPQPLKQWSNNCPQQPSVSVPAAGAGAMKADIVPWGTSEVFHELPSATGVSGNFNNLNKTLKQKGGQVPSQGKGLGGGVPVCICVPVLLFTSKSLHSWEPHCPHL